MLFFRCTVQAIKTKLDDADKKRKAELAAGAESRADELVAAGLGPLVVDVLKVGTLQKVNAFISD